MLSFIKGFFPKCTFSPPFTSFNALFMKHPWASLEDAPNLSTCKEGICEDWIGRACVWVQLSKLWIFQYLHRTEPLSNQKGEYKLAWTRRAKTWEKEREREREESHLVELESQSFSGHAWLVGGREKRKAKKLEFCCLY